MLDMDTPRCPECGTLMEDLSVPGSPHWHCNYCDTESDDGVEPEYCAECGEPVSSYSNYCDFCTEQIQAEIDRHEGGY